MNVQHFYTDCLFTSPGGPQRLEYPQGNAKVYFAADYDRLKERIAMLEEALHAAQYQIGELGRSWTATIVTPECQKIQRKIKAVYDRYGATP